MNPRSRVGPNEVGARLVAAGGPSGDSRSDTSHHDSAPPVRSVVTVGE